MVPDSLKRFVVTVGIALVVAFVLGALLTPPDPFTQLLFVVAALVPVSVLVYVLRYRGGYAALRRYVG